MDLRTLRSFVEVVRQGGFSAAGKTLFATQPTVSKAVRQLEDEVGAPLLDRIGHRIQPTAVGEIVYRHAIAMLTERDHLLAELAELRGLKQGTLRLGLLPLGSSILFAPLFAEYRRRYPGIRIAFREHGSITLEEMVSAGEIELGMSLLPVVDTFEAQLVHDDPLVVMLPAGHCFAGRSRIKLAELADSAFILFESGFALNARIDAACRACGFIPREAARSGQADFIVALVAAGLGIALLPRLITDQRAEAPVHRAMLDEDSLRWRAALIWRRGSTLSPAARAWLELAAMTEL